MMTIKDIGQMLDLLESNYGAKFYEGTQKGNVLKTWAVMFKDDDPALVMDGVQKCINTMSYKPTIADIRKQMAQSQMSGQLTEIEAFLAIKDAVNKSSDWGKAREAFNELPDICRKLVVKPAQLRDWRTVSDEAFESVIASMITRSYRVLAEREADYYALPARIQKKETWRISAPEAVALPEASKPKTLTEILDRMDLDAQKYREDRDMRPNPKYTDRVNDFKKPVTEEDIKKVERAENRKAEWSLK